MLQHIIIIITALSAHATVCKTGNSNTVFVVLLLFLSCTCPLRKYHFLFPTASPKLFFLTRKITFKINKKNPDTKSSQNFFSNEDLIKLLSLDM